MGKPDLAIPSFCVRERGRGDHCNAFFFKIQQQNEASNFLHLFFYVKQKMMTPLGTNNMFVTDEYLVTQSDINCTGRTGKSLIVEFDQSIFEEYLSSGSESHTTTHATEDFCLRFVFLRAPKQLRLFLGVQLMITMVQVNLAATYFFKEENHNC